MRTLESQLKVTNSSSSTPIFVRFRPPEDATTPDFSGSREIPPKGTESFYINDSTMNMFVWVPSSTSGIDIDSKVSSDFALRWKGIIPTKTRETVVFSPEESKLSYGGIVIPEGFGIYTGTSQEEFLDSSKNNDISGGDRTWLWMILVAVIIGIIAYFILSRR